MADWSQYEEKPGSTDWSQFAEPSGTQVQSTSMPVARKGSAPRSGYFVGGDPQAVPSDPSTTMKDLRAGTIGAGMGATAGLGKYPVAAIAWLTDRARNIMNDTPGVTWEQALKLTHDEINDTRAASPKSYTGGNIVGSVVGAGKLSKMLPGAGASGLPGIANMAATGGIQGAATGFSENSGMENAGTDTAKGLGVGTLFGTLGGGAAAATETVAAKAAASALAKRFNTVARQGSETTQNVSGLGPAAYKRMGSDLSDKIKSGEQLTAEELQTVQQTLEAAGQTRDSFLQATGYAAKNAATGAVGSIPVTVGYNAVTGQPLDENLGRNMAIGAGVTGGGPSLVKMGTAALRSDVPGTVKGALGVAGGVPGVGAAASRGTWAAEDALIKRAVTGVQPGSTTAPTVTGLGSATAIPTVVPPKTRLQQLSADFAARQGPQAPSQWDQYQEQQPSQWDQYQEK